MRNNKLNILLLDLVRSAIKINEDKTLPVKEFGDLIETLTENYEKKIMNLIQGGKL